MGQIKEINIKNWTYYFFNDIINIEEFDSNLLKTDKKSYKKSSLIFTTMDTLKLKELVAMKIYTV